jgi:hypothetical protein
VHPHEALGMQTPATLWRPSLRRYDPHPPRWEYPQGAWVLKVDCQGKLDIQGNKRKISRALAGEWVQVVPVEQRMMVFYCTTLMRELDAGTRKTVSKDVSGLDKKRAWVGHPPGRILRRISGKLYPSTR